MPFRRRRFLAASAALAASPLFAQGLPALLPASGGRRVVIVGGGWAGLSAARRLRDLAPELDVVLLERNTVFRSAPLGNKWLAGRVDERLLTHDYAVAAKAYGYSFLRAEVTAIDREKRRVVTSLGTLDYDWLVLAVGVRDDYAPWFGDDSEAAGVARRRYPAAFVAGDEILTLKAKVESFAGGDFLMTIPPQPYRCPPAPYERACMIANRFRERGIKARIIVVDAGPGVLGFHRIFAEHYKDWITYLPQSRLTQVDLRGRRVATDFEDIAFDDAILMPPQQAGDLIWQAGLIGVDGTGKPTGWADQHPVHLHARGDERVFLVGDLMGQVSPLFGHYTKTGQAATRLGRIAAEEIAARFRGREPERQVPDSVCYVTPRLDPPELIRVETEYRLRGGEMIAQTGRQVHDRQPRGEDIQWAKGMFAEMLAWRE
ncbi:MAG: FAD-dependent oxidoreductase [Sterolibacteriaceae bacterium MAG5]|nr:FAD-dependent oxidoreductase [Candidatus Nitricoxidireducens bremensis]